MVPRLPSLREDVRERPRTAPAASPAWEDDQGCREQLEEDEGDQDEGDQDEEDQEEQDSQSHDSQRQGKVCKNSYTYRARNFSYSYA